MHFLTPCQRECVADLYELAIAEVKRIDPAHPDDAMERLRRASDNLDTIAALLPRRDPRPVAPTA